MPKLYYGSRGGVYYKRKGRKVYVHRFGNPTPDFVTQNCQDLGIDCNQFTMKSNYITVKKYINNIRFIKENPNLQIEILSWNEYKSNPYLYDAYIKLAEKHMKLLPNNNEFPKFKYYHIYREFLSVVERLQNLGLGVPEWNPETDWEDYSYDINQSNGNKENYNKIINKSKELGLDVPEWNPETDWGDYSYYLAVYEMAQNNNIEIEKWGFTDGRWDEIYDNFKKYLKAKKLSEEYGIPLPIEVEKPFRGNQDFNTVIIWLEYANLANKFKDVIEDYREIGNDKIKEETKKYKELINQNNKYKNNIIKCIDDPNFYGCIDDPDFYGCIKIEEDTENKKKNCIYKAAREAAGFDPLPDDLMDKFLLDDYCGICLDPLKNGYALCRRYQCDHLFHCMCIENVRECPHCRKEEYEPPSSFGRWYTSSSVPLGVDIKVGDVVEVGKDKNLKKSVPPSVRLKKGHRRVVCEFGSGGKIKKGSMFMVDGVSSDGSFVRAKIV